jgi:AraC-like DNA-binding protein
MLPLLYLWDSKAMYIGTSFETHVHAHNAYQVIVALDGMTKVEVEGLWIETAFIIIRPNTKHRIKLFGVVALLLIEADDAEIAKNFELENLSAKTLLDLNNCYFNLYSSEEALQLFNTIVLEVGLSSGEVRASIDERITKCLRYIEKNLKNELSMESVCKINGISESTFSHLFSKELGLPFRRYVLWKRLKESISLYLKEEKSLTDIAIEMGFADQAHFSNSFKDVFGVKPTFIFRSKLRILHSLKRIKIS